VALLVGDIYLDVDKEEMSEIIEQIPRVAKRVLTSATQAIRASEILSG
jgi:hypothetical protein